MLESIVMHLLEPDKHSVAVAHHLLKAPVMGLQEFLPIFVSPFRPLAYTATQPCTCFCANKLTKRMANIEVQESETS